MTTFDRTRLRSIARIIDPAFSGGHVGGHRSRFLIDGRDASDTDPFVLMAEDWVPRGAFSQHPHRGIETVTLVLEGALEHSDSAGNGGVIEADDIQWMSAGRGVIHEEIPPPDTLTHALQLWVNLPASAKMTQPRYQYLEGPTLPVRREPGAEIRVLSGRSGEVASPTLNYVPVTAIDARLEPGASFSQALEPGANGFVMVLNGRVTIGQSDQALTAGQLAWLTRDDAPDGSAVLIEAGDSPSRVLLFAGKPLREPIVFGGPFVMNSQAEIVQAFSDYREGRF
jgi:redox-sensitive bicupin YhaK (pirin superfamily)